MRFIKATLAAVILTLAGLASAGCSEQAVLETSEAVGASLEAVAANVPEDAEFLIQDSSPRVGEASSFSLGSSDQAEWTVAAVCADADQLNAAKAVEVAIIPTRLYTASVRAEIRHGEFRDAVTCDGLSHR